MGRASYPIRSQSFTLEEWERQLRCAVTDEYRHADDQAVW
jgi:hypothetical protein